MWVQGDEPGRHLGEPEGHVGTITSLFYYKHTAYSGSIDTTIMVWDTRKHQVRQYTERESREREGIRHTQRETEEEWWGEEG